MNKYVCALSSSKVPIEGNHFPCPHSMAQESVRGFRLNLCPSSSNKKHGNKNQAENYRKEVEHVECKDLMELIYFY